MLAIIIEDKKPIMRSNKSDLVFNLLRAYFGKNFEKLRKLERTLEKFNRGSLKRPKKKKFGSIVINIKGLEYADDGATFELTFNGKIKPDKLIKEAFILQGFRDKLNSYQNLSKIKKVVFSTEVRLHLASFDETKFKKHELRDIKEVAMNYYDI